MTKGQQLVSQCVDKIWDETMDTDKDYRKPAHSCPTFKNTRNKRTNKRSLWGQIWPTGQFVIPECKAKIRLILSVDDYQ